ncbi:hypothetical protein KBY97_05715 [Synechococcus sp. ATX 2A4]|uniref:hypothetical protein n=1 Tax=Synechococcus sp. ATX 2A4 TaxID=2823727 RepID=UPI0020CD186F|nr:hypothetical protein [Synechococcus sp. ATX 2A4]MCP9884621.1 hypothetical protein [Synechococcus sp. ATX 2A4]
MASPPSVPTSRAFWDLKAEQVMDRVFANGANRTSVALLDHTPIDVVVSEAPPRAPAPPPPSRATRTATPTSFWQHPWLLVIAALALVGLTSSLLLWRNWQVANRALDQERNLKLLERLRDLVPAAAEPVALPAGQGAGAVATPDPSLPPPPLEEPWVQELAPLSGGTAGQASTARPLRVPVNGTITRAAPAAAAGGNGWAVGDTVGGSASPKPAVASPASSASSGPAPQLMGVVQVQGRSGSAIFQVGDTTTNVSVGEPIGASGWRLQSASSDSVVIERQGQQRQVSISTYGP